MSTNDNSAPQAHGAAAEAAQHVVDGVTSWEYAAEEGQIAEELTEGLSEAGVEVSTQEQDRLVEEIDAAKDETAGAPQVRADEVSPAQE